MYKKLDRAPRTNLVSQGFIYMGEEEHKITVKNLSISGVLAQLNTDRTDIDIKYIFNQLLISTIVDLYLPEMRLIGEAQVVRADMEEGHILLAMEFKNIAFDVDNALNKRKAYRKNIAGQGRILLNGDYHYFTTVNVSVEGLMICLTETISAEEGAITPFEFNHLKLEGKVKIIWFDHISDNRTLIGLQYIDMKKHALKGIPSFTLQQKV